MPPITIRVLLQVYYAIYNMQLLYLYMYHLFVLAPLLEPTTIMSINMHCCLLTSLIVLERDRKSMVTCGYNLFQYYNNNVSIKIQLARFNNNYGISRLQ